MQKIFDFQAGAYRYVDDDEPINILRPRTVRLRCLVCQRNERAGSITGLCVNCCANPSETLGWVYSCAESVEDRVEATCLAWDNAWGRACERNDPVCPRFTAYHESTDTVKRTQAETAARNGTPGPLADLIRLWLDFDSACAKAKDVKQWVKQCEERLI
jgi:hypothetical protein